MIRPSTNCPGCNATEVQLNANHRDWTCDQCRHQWEISVAEHEQLADWCWTDYENNGRAKQLSSYVLAHLPTHLIGAGRWDNLAGVLSDIFYLEARAEHGQVLELVADFKVSVKALPKNHHFHRRLQLLAEATRRDVHFIASCAEEYPQVLFQCLWNSCWWYDSPESGKYFKQQREDVELYKLLELWRDEKTRYQGNFHWLRSLRPPRLALGGPLVWSFHRSSEIESLAFSRDGHVIVVLPHDGPLTVWDIESERKLLEIKHKGRQNGSVAISPCGRSVAIARQDSKVAVYELKSGDRLLEIDHDDNCQNVMFSHNGCMLAVLSHQYPVTIWDSHTGQLIHSLAHPSPVFDATFVQNDEVLFTVAEDRRIRAWDTNDGSEIRHFEHDGCRSLMYLRDSSRLITVGNHRVRLWDVETGSEVDGFEDDSLGSKCILSPDGKSFAACSSYSAKVWDIESKKVMRRYSHNGSVRDIQFSPDGSQIAAGTYLGDVCIWDLDSAEALPELDDHSGQILAAVFSPDGEALATGSADRTVRLWDREGCLIREFLGHERPVNGVGFMANGRDLASREHGRRSEAIGRFWNLTTGECVGTTDRDSISNAPLWRAMDIAWAVADLPGRTHSVIDRASGETIARFPRLSYQKFNAERHPSLPLWAVGDGSHLRLFRLEGVDAHCVSRCGELSTSDPMIGSGGDLTTIVDGLESKVPAVRAAATAIVLRWFQVGQSGPPLVNSALKKKSIFGRSNLYARLVSNLTGLVEDEAIYTSFHAALALMKIGEQSRAITVALANGLKSKQTSSLYARATQISSVAREALKDIDSHVEAVIPQLIDALGDSDIQETYSSGLDDISITLFKLGDTAIPSLVVALQHRSIRVRQGVVYTLFQIAKHRKAVDAVEGLKLAAQRDDNEEVRRHAASALRALSDGN